MVPSPGRSRRNFSSGLLEVSADTDGATAMDRILFGMEAGLLQVDAAQSSKVKLTKAELDFLQHTIAARDFMMATLSSGGTDRRRLREIFGGDCVRISRTRAVLESVRLSEALYTTDDPVDKCINACESVENVLGDLGLGWTLKRAQENERKVLDRQRAARAAAVACRAVNPWGETCVLDAAAELASSGNVALGATHASAFELVTGVSASQYSNIELVACEADLRSAPKASREPVPCDLVVSSESAVLELGVCLANSAPKLVSSGAIGEPAILELGICSTERSAAESALCEQFTGEPDLTDAAVLEGAVSRAYQDVDQLGTSQPMAFDCSLIGPAAFGPTAERTKRKVDASAGRSPAAVASMEPGTCGRELAPVDVAVSQPGAMEGAAILHRASGSTSGFGKMGSLDMAMQEPVASKAAEAEPAPIWTEPSGGEAVFLHLAACGLASPEAAIDELDASTGRAKVSEPHAVKAASGNATSMARNINTPTTRNPSLRAHRSCSEPAKKPPRQPKDTTAMEQITACASLESAGSAPAASQTSDAGAQLGAMDRRYSNRTIAAYKAIPRHEEAVSREPTLHSTQAKPGGVDQFVAEHIDAATPSSTSQAPTRTPKASKVWPFAEDAVPVSGRHVKKNCKPMNTSLMQRASLANDPVVDKIVSLGPMAFEPGSRGQSAVQNAVSTAEPAQSPSAKDGVGNPSRSARGGSVTQKVTQTTKSASRSASVPDRAAAVAGRQVRKNSRPMVCSHADWEVLTKELVGGCAPIADVEIKHAIVPEVGLGLEVSLAAADCVEFSDSATVASAALAATTVAASAHWAKLCGSTVRQGTFREVCEDGTTCGGEPMGFSELSPQRQILVRRIFDHYVGAGGIAAGTGLSLRRFRQLLRDGGVLAVDPTSENGLTTCDGLPLHSFPDGPPLTQAEADLTLVQAVAIEGEGQLKQLLQTAEALFWALEYVAAKCVQELESACLRAPGNAGGFPEGSSSEAMRLRACIRQCTDYFEENGSVGEQADTEAAHEFAGATALASTAPAAFFTGLTGSACGPEPETACRSATPTPVAARKVDDPRAPQRRSSSSGATVSRRYSTGSLTTAGWQSSDLSRGSGWNASPHVRARRATTCNLTMLMSAHDRCSPAFEKFCEVVLVPLAELFPAGQEVSVAVALLSDPEIARLLRRSQQGLSTVFARYAKGVNVHWAVQDVSRFALDVKLTAHLSVPVLHRLFGECVHYEARCGRGAEDKLSFAGFQLLALALSQRVNQKMQPTPRERLAAFLFRVFMVTGPAAGAPRGCREPTTAARTTQLSRVMR